MRNKRKKVGNKVKIDKRNLNHRNGNFFNVILLNFHLFFNYFVRLIFGKFIILCNIFNN